ncbi:MAG: alpha-ketoacid dehydrogenase subunit beta, partial [Candidatus Scalindua sp.]|nr:alpha-ketoacid dehydrogenase subunit beta [Candidatus Scalindua sp.]
LSYMTIEALHAIEVLAKQGVHCELIDLRTVNPIDWETIFKSVEKTGGLIALDTATETLSIASEVVARVSMELFGKLRRPPARIALADFPAPTTTSLTERYYKRAEDIVITVGKMLGKKLDIKEILNSRKSPHDVPGDWFKGPF